MATIKDVAKLAGVSHGTVTNVLNNTGNVNIEKVRRVMDAVEALKYSPQVAARNLKNSSMNAVGVILPNVTDSFFAQLYSSVESTLTAAGYSVMLFLTKDIIEKEKQAVSVAMTLRLSGLILVTCQPDNTEFFQELMKNSTIIVFVEREPKDIDCNFICFQNDKSIRYATSLMLKKDLAPVALITGPDNYSSERMCLEGYKSALEHADEAFNGQYVRHTDYTNESGFKSAMQLISLDPPPQAILCTSTQLLEGAIGALQWSGHHANLVSLSEASWNDNRYKGIDMIPRLSYQMGEKAGQLLIENMRSPVFYDHKRIFINNIRADLEEPVTKKPVINFDETVRVLLPADTFSTAFEIMLPDLKKRFGISAKLEAYSYNQLHDEIWKKSHDNDCDVFLFDIPWLAEFASNGLICDMTPFLENSELDLDTLLLNNMEKYLKYDDMIHALPHRIVNQLLFYRKDYFEDLKLRQIFFSQYHSELNAPRSWPEFNAIARFFTKQFNPESPTTYGYTMGVPDPSVVITDFLPRLWALGGDVFDHRGHIQLSSPEALKALTSYLESAAYTLQSQQEDGWERGSVEFSKGDVAMMIAFSTRVPRLSDRSISNVVGKVGFDEIPGGVSVLGGWLFGINSKSKKKDIAFEFVKWACSRECSIPITILGGFSATRDLYSSGQLQELYPWLNKTMETLERSRMRAFPKEAAKLSIKHYELILADAINKSLVGAATPKEALEEASDRMDRFIRGL
ncbi:MAG: extracellular solute-binding protein [Christensenellaceae bacterium]|nr:extracellular solute-binding protein [Christensenellaceae bacterium]